MSSYVGCGSGRPRGEIARTCAFYSRYTDWPCRIRSNTPPICAGRSRRGSSSSRRRSDHDTGQPARSPWPPSSSARSTGFCSITSLQGICDGRRGHSIDWRSCWQIEGEARAMKRIFFVGVAIWLLATIALRLAGQRLFVSDTTSMKIILLAGSAPLMFALPRRLFKVFSIAPADRAIGGVVFVPPRPFFFPLHALWVLFVFP